MKAGKEKKAKIAHVLTTSNIDQRGDGICPTIFLTDCLKTKANLKMEVVNSDQPKILESIFLSKFCDA